MRSALADAAAAGVLERVSTPRMIVALSGAISRRPSPAATIVGVKSRAGVCAPRATGDQHRCKSDHIWKHALEPPFDVTFALHQRSNWRCQQTSAPATFVAKFIPRCP